MRSPLLLLLAAVVQPCLAQSAYVIPAASAPAAISPPCDCTTYPFRPNPPCFGSCIAKLASTPNPDLAFVKGLDPGVAVSIKVLAANPKKEEIDFARLKGKFDLEKAADKSFQGNELRLIELHQREPSERYKSPSSKTFRAEKN